MIAGCHFGDLPRNGLEEDADHIQFRDAFGIELSYISSGDDQPATVLLQNESGETPPFEHPQCVKPTDMEGDQISDVWRQSYKGTSNHHSEVAVLLLSLDEEFNDFNLSTSACQSNGLENMFGFPADKFSLDTYADSSPPSGTKRGELDLFSDYEIPSLIVYHHYNGIHEPFVSMLLDQMEEPINNLRRSLCGSPIQTCSCPFQAQFSCTIEYSNPDHIGTRKGVKPTQKIKQRGFDICALCVFLPPWMSEDISNSSRLPGREGLQKEMKIAEIRFGCPRLPLESTAFGQIDYRGSDFSIPGWVPRWNDALCIIHIYRGSFQYEPYDVVHYSRDWSISTALHVSRQDSWMQGTCQWIFANKEYLHWREQSDGTLWLSGAPGTGKSMLTSTVISRLQDDHRVGEFIVTYCADADYRGASHVTAILWQILIKMLLREPRGKLRDDIKSVLSDLIHTGNRVSVPRMKVILSIIRHSLRRDETMYLLLDGLDDTGDSSSDQDLIKEFIDHASHPDPNHRIKCFVSTRPNFFRGEILTRTMQSAKRVDLDSQPLNKEDLILYVRDNLQRSALLKESPESKELEQKLTAGASGSFLWVRLIMNTFRYSAGPGATLKAVKDFIASSILIDLDRLYSILLDQISEPHRFAALSMLKWVVHAARPLHVQELLDALHLQTGIRLNGSNISDISSGLLTSTAGQIVRVAHSTVRSFLQGQMKSKWEAISLEAHETIAATCLRALNQESLLRSLGLLSRSINTDTNKPAFEYAETHWSFHYSIAELRSSYLAGLLHSLMMKSLELHGRPSTNADSSKLDKIPDLPTHGPGQLSFLEIISTILIVGSRFGFLKLVKLELEMGADANFPVGPELLTPLMWASRAGNIDVVELLIQYGADVHLQSASGNTSLMYAVTKGNLEIVELLLASGATAHMSVAGKEYSEVAFQDLSLDATFSSPCSICGAVETGYEISNTEIALEDDVLSPIKIPASFISQADATASTTNTLPRPGHKTKIKWFPGKKMHKALRLATKRGVDDLRKLLIMAGNDIDVVERSLEMSRLVAKLRIA